MKVQQIADEAGIGKGTVYEYFASKDEILQGMALYCFDTEIARHCRIDGAMHHPARAGGRRDGLPAGSFRQPDGNLAGDRFQYWRTGEPPRYGRVCASPAWGAAQNHGSPAAKEINLALPDDYCDLALLSAAAGGLIGLCYVSKHPDALTPIQNLRVLIHRALNP